MRQQTGHGRRLGGTLAALTASAVLGVSQAAAAPGLPLEPPLNLPEQITDNAGVLGGDTTSLEGELEDLRGEGLQLFVVFVDSFDGIDSEQWAEQTFEESGMGGDDVLLAVAVDDRRYSTWATGESGLTAQADQQVRAQYIEPELAEDDWAGAVTAAADGYAAALEDTDGSGVRTGAGPGFGLFGLLFVLLPLLFVIGAFLRMRRRFIGATGRTAGPTPAIPAPAPPPVPQRSIDDLRGDVAVALVDVDDAIRSSADELAFAEAQFGAQATHRFKQALDRARASSAEGFRLLQELDDRTLQGRVDEADERARLEQIIALATDADRSLDAEEEEFVRLRDLQARVPEFLAELRTRLAGVRQEVPVAEQELAGLRVHHSPAALATVSESVTQASSLLDAAAEFVDTGEAHLREGDKRGPAVAAARAAEEAIGQADSLLRSVGNAREELAQATSRLQEALASISSDLADARRLRADDQMTRTAVAAAEKALAQGSAARDGGDPIAALRALERAEHELDTALARYRERDDRSSRSRQRLEQRMGRVGARLQSIDTTISTRRGAIGPQARAFIAEALRTFDEAVRYAADDPDAAVTLLQRAEELGEAALEEARHDLDSWDDGFGGGYGGGRMVGGFGISPGSLILGGILGGVLGGGLGGGRGGGWGGSSGGFGGGGGFSGGGFGGGGRF